MTAARWLLGATLLLALLAAGCTRQAQATRGHQSVGVGTGIAF